MTGDAAPVRAPPTPAADSTKQVFEEVEPKPSAAAAARRLTAPVERLGRRRWRRAARLRRRPRRLSPRRRRSRRQHGEDEYRLGRDPGMAEAADQGEGPDQVEVRGGHDVVRQHQLDQPPVGGAQPRWTCSRRSPRSWSRRSRTGSPRAPAGSSGSARSAARCRTPIPATLRAVRRRRAAPARWCGSASGTRPCTWAISRLAALPHGKVP